jgi:hypothetical protein
MIPPIPRALEKEHRFLDEAGDTTFFGNPPLRFRARAHFARHRPLRRGEPKRENVPTAEYQSVLHEEQKASPQIRCPRHTAGLDEEKHRRNHDLDSQLAWRGTAEQDWNLFKNDRKKPNSSLEQANDAADIRHIRSLRVGPLTDPERAPKSWGFFASGRPT